MLNKTYKSAADPLGASGISMAERGLLQQAREVRRSTDAIKARTPQEILEVIAEYRGGSSKVFGK